MTERLTGRQRSSNYRKAASWWSKAIKEAVKRKKDCTRRLNLNDKTDKSLKLYKEGKKDANQVEREAKKMDLVIEGKMQQRDYFVNRRRFGRQLTRLKGTQHKHQY